MPSYADPVDSVLAGEFTVLLVAEAEPLSDALEARLVARGLLVDTVGIDGAAGAAYVGAPDVVVLAGRAAQEPDELLAQFAERGATSSLPVVIVADPHKAPVDRSVFRHGVVAVIDRSASADEMAREIERLTRELPDRDGTAEGPLAAANMEELVELLSESLRSGVLSVESVAGPHAQVLVRADRPLRETLDELVARLRPLSQEGRGPLRYRFDEAPTARVSSLDVFDEGEFDDLDISGWRVLLVEQNPARADVLAQALRAIGVAVAVVDGEGEGLELARELMPDVLLVDDRGVEGWATGLLRAVRRDPWLRWASLLIVDSSRVWADPRRPDIEMLRPKIRGLVATDEELARRVREQPAVLVRLDLIGPVRLLRLLGRLGRGLRLEVSHPRLRVEVDLAEGLVAGASVYLAGRDEPTVHGSEALATLLGLHSGRARITHVDAPRSANLMSPVDDALLAATTETPAVPPSLPPPSLRPRAPVPEDRAEAVTSDIPRALDRLEAMLESLVPPANPRESSLPAHGGRPSAPVAALGDETPIVHAAARVRVMSTELFDYGQQQEDEGTGQYAPELMERLRRRMRHSDRVRAKGAGASLRPPPVSDPPPPPVSLRIPPPPKRPLGGASSGSQRPSFPRPKARLPAPPVKSESSKAAPAESSAKKRVRRRVRRDPTLVFGSAASAPPSDRPASSEGTTERPGGPGPSEGERSVPEPPSGVVVETLGEGPTDAELEAGIDAGVGMRGEVEAEANVEVEVPPEATARPEGFALPPAAAAPLEAVGPLAVGPLAVAAEAALPPMHEAGGLQEGVDVSLSAPSATDSAASRTVWIAVGAGVGVGLLVLTCIGLYLGLRPGGSTSPAEVSRVQADPDERPPADIEPEGTERPPADSASPETASADVPSPEAEAPSAAVEDSDSEDVDEAPADGATTQVAADEAVPEERTASTDIAGPRDGEPLEGSDEDWDPVVLGIESVEVPGRRRAASRMRDRLIREANRLRRQEQLPEAEAAYLRFAGAFPDDPRGMAGLARLYLERGEPARAILYAQRLTRIRPRFASNYLLLGDVLLAAGNEAAARRAFQRAVRMEPRWPPPRARLVEMGSR